MSLVDTPKGRSEGIVMKEFMEETLIYEIETHKCFCLNSTAARIWNLCNGKRSISEIAEQLSIDLKSTVSDEMVLFTLSELKKFNLLSIDEDTTFLPSGMPRRELIKKAALTSMIALPAIASLVAPTAAMAASTCPRTGIGASGSSCACPNGSGASCSSAACATGCICTNLGNGNSGGAGLRSGTCA